jgi:hypothetical protein
LGPSGCNRSIVRKRKRGEEKQYAFHCEGRQEQIEAAVIVLIRCEDGRGEKTFFASEPELISWLLGFREEARVVRPKWLVQKVKKLWMRPC